MMADDVKKHILKNGLKVLILPYKRARVASIVHWVKAGYFNEPDEIIGISHFLEHLFFKGSKTRKMEEISDEIKSLGGYINAGTIYDHTYFYTVLPSENIARAVEIISDLILNPNFPPEEIEMEKSVIVEEIKKKLDSPDQLGFEKLVEMGFDKHRIRRFRMGYEDDIRRITKEQIEKYYSDFYRPNNSIISIVGNFNHDSALKTVKRYYGSWQKGKIPVSVSPLEPKQKFPKYRQLKGDISQSYFKMGFHVPNLFSDDFYSINFASALLGKGRSSRLYKKLKEDLSLVDDVGASVYADMDLGFFVIESVLKEKNFSKAQGKIIDEVLRIIKDPPGEKDLEKIRNVIETNYFSDKEDVLGQAYNLAYFESLGNYKLSEKFLLRSLAVSGDEIVRSIRKYFKLNNLSFLEYVKGKAEIKSDRESYKMKGKKLSEFKKYFASDKDGRKKDEPRKKTKIKHKFDFNILSKHASSKPKMKINPGSLTLISKQNTGVPMISTAIYFPGGRLDENNKNCGISNLVLRSALKGTKSLGPGEIAQRLEFLGCSLRGEATADNFGYAFNVLKKNFSKAYEIISEIITKPSLSHEEVIKEKSSMKAAILARRDDMFRYPIDLCYKALFGIHPYGLPRYGTHASIDSITKEEMHSWHDQFFAPSKMVVCSVGDINEKFTKTIMEPFTDSKKRKRDRAQILPLVVKRGIKEKIENRKKKQTSFALGFQTPGVANEDFYALEVLQSLLAGMGGRLYMEVREKRGLAYTVTAFNISLMRTGAFVIYAATSPENEKKSIEIVLSEIEKIKKEGIPEKEITRAKNYTIGSSNIAMQTNLAQAYEYLRYFFIKGDIEEVDSFNEKISAVTEEDICRVVRKYFDPGNYSLGVVRGE